MGIQIWIDFDKLPSAALERILRCDNYEPERSILSDAEILQICSILAKRRKEEHPDSIIDVEKKWEEFLTSYLENEI